MKHELTCIGCPLGCALVVEIEGNRIVSVTGFTCKKGEAYAQAEMINPRRTVTSTIKVRGGDTPMVSVKTALEIPKAQVTECMAALKDLAVDAPVKINDVILSDVCGTGVDIVATKNVYPIGFSN